MLREKEELLQIPEGDASTHSQARLLGASLEAGLEMYRDLQNIYLNQKKPSPPLKKKNKPQQQQQQPNESQSSDDKVGKKEDADAAEPVQLDRLYEMEGDHQCS